MANPSGTRATGPRRARARFALLGYVGGWLLAAALIAGVAVLVFDPEEHDVRLPPLHETKLARAARTAGCELRRSTPGRRLNPPVDGAASTPPAAAGYYESPPAADSLVAALRRGIIVIQIRGEPDGSGADTLRRVQQAAPEGTIVAPNATGMPFALAATAYHHLLGCRSLSPRALDAVRLFQGRFIGSGPGR